VKTEIWETTREERERESVEEEYVEKDGWGLWGVKKKEDVGKVCGVRRED
jgi:hypothetical protein